MECRKVFLHNNELIDATNSKDEKQRLKNLNNSLLQRLKRRREEELEKHKQALQNDRM